MTSHGAIAANSPVFWVAISFTLFFVMILTYIYSGRNIRLTIFFTLLSIFSVICGAGYDSWNAYLEGHFVAGIDPLGVSFKQSRTGWFLLLDAWPLWAVPSIFLIIFVVFGLSFIFKSMLNKQEEQDASIETSLPVLQQVKLGINTDTIVQQLELDTLKKALLNANRKLKELSCEKELEELRNKELMAKLASCESSQFNTVLEDELKALLIEVKAKNMRIEEMSLHIIQQEEEIERLKGLIDTLIK